MEEMMQEDTEKVLGKNEKVNEEAKEETIEKVFDHVKKINNQNNYLSKVREVSSLFGICIS